MCKMPRGSDRLLTFINNEHMRTLSHTHARAHTHTQTPSSHLYTSPSSLLPSLRTHTHILSARPTSPSPRLFFHSPRSPSFLYDELLGGFSVWQEALSLIRDEKKEGSNKKKKRKGDGERKEEDGEGG